MLSVVSLAKSRGQGRRVLEDISFTLDAGETLAVIGPSGCGKTTLLYLLCGLLSPDPGGGIALNGQGVERPSPDIAIILQDYGLFPWKTVLDNVALGLKIQGLARRERNERARLLLEQVGLGGREGEYPGSLSGGEQQRVAIARAYATRPKLLLMDEPFSSLDAITRESLQRTLLDMWRDTGVAYVMVTHSVEEAAYLGGSVLLMAGSPAGIRCRLDNPGFGKPGYRETPDYYHMVRRLREEMRLHWTSCPGMGREDGCLPG